MDIQPDTRFLDNAIREIAQISQYVPEPGTYVEKRKLLVEIRSAADDALKAFAPVEHDAIIAAAQSVSR